jgi:hypothetical protein
MKNRTDRPDPSAEHRRAWDAIPWIVNGSVGDVQRRAVEAHVQHCDDCCGELERQRALHAALSAHSGAATAPTWIRAWPASWHASTQRAPTAPGPLRAPPGPDRRVAATAWARSWSDWSGRVVIEAVGIAILAADRRGDADAPFARSPRRRSRRPARRCGWCRRPR